MYKIIKDGEQIAITEKLNFIKQAENGVFYNCDEKEAQGVAVNNTPYNIFGRAPMTANDTVLIIEVDGGKCIQDGDESQSETDTLVIDHEYRLTLIELGVTE